MFYIIFFISLNSASNPHGIYELTVLRYLADYCMPVFEVLGCQHLRYARCHQQSVPRVCCSTFGTGVYSVAGPTVWNSLPDHLWDAAVDSEEFTQDLKTYLFAGHSKR